MDIIPSPLTVDSFKPHVGEKFSLLTSDGGHIEITLMEAEATILHPRDGRALGKSGKVRRDPFALLFTFEQMLPQGMYTMNHPVMGQLTMSLVPVGPMYDAWGHEAIFN